MSRPFYQKKNMMLQFLDLCLNNFLDIFHGTCITWKLRNSCARMVQSMLFNLFRAFDPIESSHKTDFFSLEGFFPMCVRSMF